MDKDELIFNEYKQYCEQKENFIDRNFKTNKFYMVAVIALIFALIFTGNVVFLHRISATLIFAIFGVAAASLWWMNVDSYNTLIKVKYANVIEKIEEQLPVKPFTEEYKGIEDFRKNKVFMFSDMQKFIAAFAALFFFAVCISELTPLFVSVYEKIRGIV
jgi:ABC-type antimicrobial peptide transport system permease subunit